MRILHVTDHYPPALGGIEAHVAALADRQAERGDEVTVVTSSPPAVEGRSLEDSGPVRVRRVRWVVEGLAVDIRSFDVVHAHVSVVAPFTAPVAGMAARRGAPTVVTVHSLWSGMGPLPALAASVAGLRSAPVVWTAVSQVAADQLSLRLPGRPQVEVLPNAVDVSPRKVTPEPRTDGSVRLVSTMRVARRKRPMQLLRMFEALGRSVSVPVELTVVGDGPLCARLERDVERAGLADRVTLTGRVDQADVPALLAVADIYVAPAVLESFGLAALEARCVGLPVVGHSASGMTEFVRPGVEGLLCATDDELVEGMRRLVGDGALRRTVSEHNRTVPSPMTWANTMSRHDTTYDAAWQATRARAPRRSLRSVAQP